MWSYYVQWQVNLMGAPTFLRFILNIIFLKLIVACRLGVIYAREDSDSNI